jgi:hypothetical protein
MGRRDSYSATPAKLLEVVRHDLWPFLALFGIAALVPTPLAGVQPKLAGRWGILALTALVVLSSIPIVFTNWQWGEIPTTPMFALILCALAGMTPDGGGASRSSEPYRFVAIAGLAFFSWGELAFKNYASVVAAWSWHETYEHAPTRQWNEGGLTLGYSVRLVAPPLKHLSIVRSDGDCRVPYPIRINDGTRLLEKLAPERPHVFVLDFSNPFPIALGFDPPRGDAMWWHLIATFNLQHALPAEEALADVDVVMDPKCPEEIPTHDAMKTLYGPYIDAHFDKVDESEGWILLRRRPTATP